MSNFKCEKCGTVCYDTPNGYITGCEHYPADIKREDAITPYGVPPSASPPVTHPRTHASIDLRECGAIFELGNCYATPGAQTSLDDSEQDSSEFIAKHVLGNWGPELCAEDRQANELALCDGSRIFSVYKTGKGERLYVITEARDDAGRRRQTTVLLPEEY